MGSTALVSGSTNRVRPVSDALEEAGFDVIRADQPARIGELCTGLGPEALHCYIQLPFSIVSTPTRLVERTQAFLTGGLLTRFAAATADVRRIALEGIRDRNPEFDEARVHREWLRILHGDELVPCLVPQHPSR